MSSQPFTEALRYGYGPRTRSARAVEPYPADRHPANAQPFRADGHTGTAPGLEHPQHLFRGRTPDLHFAGHAPDEPGRTAHQIRPAHPATVRFSGAAFAPERPQLRPPATGFGPGNARRPACHHRAADRRSHLQPVPLARLRLSLLSWRAGKTGPGKHAAGRYLQRAPDYGGHTARRRV